MLLSSARFKVRPGWGVILAGAVLLSGCLQHTDNRIESDTFLTPAKFDDGISDVEVGLDELNKMCSSQIALSVRHSVQLDDLQVLVAALNRDVQRSLEPRSQERGDTECPPTMPVGVDEKIVLGEAEWIGFPTFGTALRARVDTGATTSSLSASEITPFERDGANWVRFKLGLTEDDDAADHVQDKWFERPIEREVRIIQAAGTEKRLVISLPIVLGPLQQSTEFTLNDRTHMTFPVLLGRRFVRDIAVVDVSQSYGYSAPSYPDPDSAGEPGDQPDNGSEDASENDGADNDGADNDGAEGDEEDRFDEEMSDPSDDNGADGEGDDQGNGRDAGQDMGE